MPVSAQLDFVRQWGAAPRIPLGGKPIPVPPDFTLNSPIGICVDQLERVWLCDTSNNRLLILDKDYRCILQAHYGPMGVASGDNPEFIMPFHLAHHPVERRVYLTDIGNGRICRFDYDAEGVITAGLVFRGGENGIAPLVDPNGVALVRESNGEYSVMAADEFYHQPGELINRIVRFNEEGQALGQFQHIETSEGQQVPLMWPQGLASDHRGNLYIANTGLFAIYRTDSSGRAVDFVPRSGKRDCCLHSFGNPEGLGQFNILRGVAVLGDRILVPDHIVNTIAIYDLDGNSLGLMSGMVDWWPLDALGSRSLTGLVQNELSDRFLVGAYGVAANPGEPDVLYLTEPLLSHVIKVRVDLSARLPETPMLLLAELGVRRARRNLFSFVTEVAPVAGSSPDVTVTEIPGYVRYNPLQVAYSVSSRLATWQYNVCYDLILRRMNHHGELGLQDAPVFAVDAGNWCVKRIEDSGHQEKIQYGKQTTFYLPGDIAMATYHPRKPLLGQLCPGTPLFLVANYTMGMVRMYQYNRFGDNLVPYGLPFGSPGTFGPTLLGPLGMDISADGDIYVANSLDHSISQWKILQTGQVVFIRQFGEKGAAPGQLHTPTDVAIDHLGRLLITDQDNNRIQAFSAQGEFLWAYGHQGYCDDLQLDAECFLLPVSLAVDGDRVVINDLVNRALKIFRVTETGLEFLGGTQRFGDRVIEGRLWMPFMISACDGYVFVPDCTLNVISVFRLVETAVGAQRGVGSARVA